MDTSDPIHTIDKGGKPGRPATVRRTAEKLISLEIYVRIPGHEIERVFNIGKRETKHF